jgi:DNA-binding transcriptional MerR regulator
MDGTSNLRRNPVKENQNFELPNATDKLSHKFILDALKDRAQEEIKAESTINPPEVAAPAREVAKACEETVPFVPLDLPKEKKYFRIGEVADVVGVEPYVLRYWENEFSMVRPVKSRSGQRVYARKDVETLHYIRHLLHVEKFSIKGAKKKLLEQRRQVNLVKSPSFEKNHEFLKTIAHDLKQLIQVLGGNPGLVINDDVQ